jgi:hypothetical protein
MIRSRSIPRAVGNWTTIVFATLTLGCQPEVSSQAKWDTALPPGVSSDPVTFQQQVGTIVPMGARHTRRRAATCDQCTVEVSIQAIYDTRTIKPDSAPATGVAVAHIQNLDSTKTEAYYGFLPSAQADYYFWVDKTPGADNARITVLEVPIGGGRVRAGSQKNLGYCHMHRPGYAGPPDADFLEYKEGPCTVAAAAGARINTASLFTAGQFGKMFARIAAKLRDDTSLEAQGGWIDCNSGCCT